MAFHTPIDREALAELLDAYGLGAVRGLQGISAGIENSNYFLECEQGEFVLTLFEELPEREIPPFLDLMEYLAGAGLPVPHALADRNGQRLHRLSDLPAILVPRLPGHSIETPGPEHCATIGSTLAQIHLSAPGAGFQRDNPRGLDWWRQVAQDLGPDLPVDQQALLEAELGFQSRYRLADLPQGTLHADLFHDNVLFENGTLSGILDFYSACQGSLLYDLAVAVCDWCGPPGGLPDAGLSGAMLGAYHQLRPLTPLERGAWPVVLRQAALRFWLSRLWQLRQGREQHKDPEEYRRLLDLFVKNEAYCRNLWPAH